MPPKGGVIHMGGKVHRLFTKNFTWPMVSLTETSLNTPSKQISVKLQTMRNRTLATKRKRIETPLCNKSRYKGVPTIVSLLSCILVASINGKCHVRRWQKSKCEDPIVLQFLELGMVNPSWLSSSSN